MPVTVALAEHAAKPWLQPGADTTEKLLPQSEWKKSKGVIQCSVLPEENLQTHITSSTNGLVWAAHYAYSNHHHLTLRPEDIWFAIISQLGFYINAHAEELRSMFVAHKGRKQLVVHALGTIHTIDFGEIAKCLADTIQKNVTRPDLQAWIVPSFSTTTDTDRAVASVLFMGAMQKYFSFACVCFCGIPSVTLLGQQEDWEDILQRLDVLSEFGQEPAEFADLLRPVLRGMIATFDLERTLATIDFWSRIANMIPWGSGSAHLSGWITAFCFWNTKGKPIFRIEHDMYHKVDFKNIPMGYATVPLTINDNGQEYLATMVAGSFGIEAFSQQKVIYSPDGHAAMEDKSRAETTLSGDDVSSEGRGAGLDSIKPLTGWMMYHTNTFEDGHIKNLQSTADGSDDRVDRVMI